jgi:hypothetical protein
MQKFLQLINGHKSLIVGLLGAIIAYLIGKGYIGTEEAMFFNTVLGLLGYTASRYTKKNL